MKRRKRVTRSLSKTLHTRHPLMLALFVAAGVALCVIGAGILWVALTPVPDLTSFTNRKVEQSTKIYDRTGQTVLYDLNPDVRRNIVPLADISPYIQKATIATEDANFYQHGAISIVAIGRSILADLVSGSYAQGGSTITQQVVKNTLLTREKSVVRKVHEWILAIKLEQKYTKDQILELYLNYIPYGGVIYGADAASRTFFGKSAGEVDLAEAAYIAALPQSPTYYSPYGNNRAALDTRKNYVLGRMKQLGYISQAQYDEARSEVVVFNPPQNSSIIAPHFVFYIRQYLEQKYGADVATQGLNVVTTLDVDMQHNAEAIVAQYAATNQTQFNASNEALIAIDAKTGQILSMVGSRNYFDPEIQGNYNAALAERQPGSSFKPFVYATALTKGYTPQTAVFDLPTQFSTACNASDVYNDTPPCYAPSNFDNKFRGPMTFTTALAQSINVPAVKVLYVAGISDVISLAKQVGINLPGKPTDYGLSLALGAAEVRLLDLTDAYGVFADNGIYNPATGILKITDAHGAILEDYKPQPTQVLDAGVAHDISSMLSNNDARQPEYPPVNPLYFPGFDVAVKTGTTNDSRDAWTIGYTPSVVVGVWAGNNDNSPMVKEIAGYIVAPMWHAFMQTVLDKYPQEYFGEPRPVPDNAPQALHGIYQDASGPHDLLYWVNKDNPLLPAIDPAADPQFAHWEYSVRNWGGGSFGTPQASAATTSQSTN